MDNKSGKAMIHSTLCKGCGLCVSSCRSGAIHLKGFENRITHRLSGGEKKLVLLATVLVMQPKALLLDEPTTGLDQEARATIASLLNRLDISYVIVSHEYDFMMETTREIYSMTAGKIAYNGAADTLHSHFHKHQASKHPHAY